MILSTFVSAKKNSACAVPLDRWLMGKDRRVAIDVITSTFIFIITTDTPEGGSWGISS